MSWGIVLIIFFIVWIHWIEPHFFKYHSRIIRLDKPIAHPIKILHLSDLHFTKHSWPLKKYLKKISEKEYDFVFLTGDLIDSADGVGLCVQSLKSLKARYGVYAILGNHDYFDYNLYDCFFRNFRGEKHPIKRNPWFRLREGLESIGIQVLKNKTIELDDIEPKIFIHGIDDPVTGRDKVEKLEVSDNSEHLQILLTHVMDILIDENLPVDLSFSGHTHGGQFRLPSWGAIITHSKGGRAYADGLKMYKNTKCVISRGLGQGRFLPIRFLCRPEAIEINLEGSTNQ